MDKRKPTHDLEAFKQQMGNVARLRMTGTATRSALELGFGPAAVVEVIQSIERADFYKSTTSYDDHKQWQDVYHVNYESMTLYIKFTEMVVCEFVITSFKEK